MKSKTKTTTVTIPLADWEWVKGKQKFTYSGLLKWAIDQHRKWDAPEDIL